MLITQKHLSPAIEHLAIKTKALKTINSKPHPTKKSLLLWKQGLGQLRNYAQFAVFGTPLAMLVATGAAVTDPPKAWHVPVFTN